LFVTVKHVYPAIKWCQEKPAAKETGTTEVSMKNLDVIAAALVIIGALNWGLAGVFHLDLVATVFGITFAQTSAASSVVYALVALSGLYQALTCKSIQRRWHTASAGACLNIGWLRLLHQALSRVARHCQPTGPPRWAQRSWMLSFQRRVSSSARTGV
jgi:uncharacterized protein